MMRDFLLSYLKPSPVPRCVPVCGSLQMTKLNLICRIRASYAHRKLNFEKLVRLCPLHLELHRCILQMDKQRDLREKQKLYQKSGCLCVELDVGTHGIHDDLLRDSAFIADPQGEADTASDSSWERYLDRLHHFHYWLPKELFFLDFTIFQNTFLLTLWYL